MINETNLTRPKLFQTETTYERLPINIPLVWIQLNKNTKIKQNKVQIHTLLELNESQTETGQIVDVETLTSSQSCLILWPMLE